MPAPLDPECLFRVLDEHGVEYVLVGGLAAVLHGSPTTTNDADIFPESSAANLARLGEALIDLEARLRSETDPEGVPFDPHPALLGSVAMLTMATRCGDLDLTFGPIGLDGYEEVAAAGVTVDLETVTIRIAALDDIIESKAAADRLKDRAVLPVLRALRDEISRDRS